MDADTSKDPLSTTDWTGIFEQSLNIRNVILIKGFWHSRTWRTQPPRVHEGLTGEV